MKTRRISFEAFQSGDGSFFYVNPEKVTGVVPGETAPMHIGGALQVELVPTARIYTGEPDPYVAFNTTAEKAASRLSRSEIFVEEGAA